LGEKIRLLESKNLASNLNPFMNLGGSLGGGSASRGSYVLQTDFKKAKLEIEEAFLDVKKPYSSKVVEQLLPPGLLLRSTRLSSDLEKLKVDSQANCSR
jgi:hypothetical protein